MLLIRGAGWLALCAFALCTAAVTALGRSTMSSVFLHDSRYTSFSVYLVIGLAGLLAVVLAEWPGQRRRAILTAAGALSVIVVGLHVSASAQSFQAMRAWREERLQSKACLALINAVDSPCTTTKLGPARGWVLEVSAALNKLGLLHPPLLPTARLPEPLTAAAPLDPAYGKLVSLRRLPDGSWIATGYALLPGRDEPADGVVITYDDAQGAHHVAGLATTPTQGPGSELKSRWAKWFVLPETAEVVRAYAYDAPAGRFLGAMASAILDLDSALDSTRARHWSGMGARYERSGTQRPKTRHLGDRQTPARSLSPAAIPAGHAADDRAAQARLPA